MNVMFVTVGELEKDGRLRQLSLIFSKVGEISFVQPSVSRLKARMLSLVFISFFKSLLMFLKKKSRPDIIVIDNYTAAFSFLFFKMFHPNIKFIYDMRELYVSKNKYKIVTRVLLYFEYVCLKRCDLVIFANKYREIFCRRYFKLSEKKLITIENVRYRKCHNSLMKLSFSSAVNIVSTGGYNRFRLSKKLVEDFLRLDVEKYNLYFVGGGGDDFQTDFGNVHKNIFVLDKLDLEDFAELIKNMDIGIVDYNQEDLNNRFCASGKIYEFVSYGIPIVCSENMPLKKFCNEYKVGVSVSHFDRGILDVVKNYNMYVKGCFDKQFVEYLSKYESISAKTIKEVLCII